MENRLIEKISKQQQIWDTYLSGSQVYLLFNEYSWYVLSLRKKGFCSAPKFKGNKYTKHGNKCELEIGIPYLEETFECKNDLKRSFIDNDKKLSGNFDFYNRKENVLAEIKTTHYLKNTPFKKQNDTIKHAIYQLSFYKYMTHKMVGTYPLTYLVIINNKNNCVSEEGICNHKVELINELELRSWGNDVVEILDTNWERLAREFFNDVAELKYKGDEESEMLDLTMEQINQYDVEIKELTRQQKMITDNALAKVKDELKVIKKKIIEKKKNKETIKKTFTPKSVFYYSYQRKELLYKYTISVETFDKVMFGIKTM